MSMTVIVTRDVTSRFRGFLTSCMVEVSAGVYIASCMTPSVRERVWKVLGEWHSAIGSGAIVLLWQESSAPSGLGMNVLGEPPKKLVNHEGLLLAKSEFRTGKF